MIKRLTSIAVLLAALALSAPAFGNTADPAPGPSPALTGVAYNGARIHHYRYVRRRYFIRRRRRVIFVRHRYFLRRRHPHHYWRRHDWR